MLVYEHKGSKTEKVHIHALLMGCNCDAERLKQICKEHGVTSLKGNAAWSFKTKHKELGSVTEDTKDGYVTYMSKGQLMPLYNKGFTDEYLIDMRDRWVDPKEYLSKDERLYSEFEKTLPVDQLRKSIADWRATVMQTSKLVDPFSRTETDVLVERVRSWAFAQTKCFWTVRTGVLAKMVILTYCMRHHLPMPKDIKMF